MAVKTLEYEPTLGLDSNNIFSYNLDDLVDKPLTGENDWDLKEFWDNFETFFDNDPQSVVMNNKAMSQSVIASNSEYDLDSAYLNTSAFLSPVSLAPSSPSQLNDDTLEKNINLTDEFEPDLVNNESAIELFKLLMSGSSSNNSNDDTDDVVDYVNDNSFIDNNVCHEEILTYAANTGKTGKISGKRKSSDSDSTSDINTGKRRKKTVISTEIKKERKKFQNKSAANRYRMKKRIEQESVDQEKEVVLKLNEELKQTLEKLQMEYKVVHPLAEAAFSGDPKRKLLLQMLHIRVLNHNVLD
jgi:vacuolar-type H+-ATPase subunit I/STV1